MPRLTVYFCPVTGRGLTHRACRRDGDRFISPFADAPAQFTGTPLLLLAVAIAIAGSIVLHHTINILAWIIAGALTALAALRFTRQLLAHRSHHRNRDP